MKYILNKIRQKRKDGFTIVETLVAVTILMIAIAGPMTIAQRSLTASIYARDQLTATYLAQDAMEYIKNYKSRNTFGGFLRDKDTGTLRCTEADPCVIETSLGLGYFHPTSVKENAVLYLPANGNGPYIANPGVQATPSSSPLPANMPTMFTRKLMVDGLTNVSNPEREATFTVLVEWPSGRYEEVSGGNWVPIMNEVRLVSQIFDVKL